MAETFSGIPGFTAPPSDGWGEEDAGDQELQSRFAEAPKANGSNGIHRPAPHFDPENPQRKPIEPLNVAAWADQQPPERKWIVPGLLLRGSVTLMTGDGGLGKSLLTLQLIAACAVNKPWLGMSVAHVRSLGFYCEDTPDEIQRRIRDVCTHYKITEAELAEHTLLYSRAGQDTVLMTFNQWEQSGGKPTAIYDDLMRATQEFGPQLTIIDTSADTFEGNENIRSQVRQYVNQLRRFATATDGGVILTAHPSNEGLSSGSGRSGSTAWHNSVRGRAYLRRPTSPKGEDAEPIDVNTRVLEFMKSNYSAIPESLNLRWEDGVFIRTDTTDTERSFTGPMETLTLEAEILNTFRKLIKSGNRLGASIQARNYYARVLHDQPALRGYKLHLINAAGERLLSDGKLVQVTIGTASRSYVYMRPSDSLYPEESQSLAVFSQSSTTP